MHPMEVIGQENHKKIKRYFQTHLCASLTQCAHDLDLHISTVRKHAAIIRAEWLNKR